MKRRPPGRGNGADRRAGEEVEHDVRVGAVWSRLWKAGAVLTSVAILIAGELLLFGDQVGHNLDVLFARQSNQVPAGRAPRPPAPLPVLAPPADGPVTQVEVRAMDTCRPGGECTVLVQLGLRPQPRPIQVAWGFEIIDRCRDSRERRPGGTVSLPPGRDRVMETFPLAIPPGRSVAVIPLTTEPVAVAGRPIRLHGDPGRC
ncbi:MAG: hypothetical protein M3357_18340 [Actinomycetota bacterium]|nr:hypothetical protein [Actinomycetota bacterium]